MKKLVLVIVMLMFAASSAVYVFSRGVQEGTPILKVVTTTSLIEQIVKQVGKKKVDVVNIIPPSQCPGHFDVKPGDIQKLAEKTI